MAPWWDTYLPTHRWTFASLVVSPILTGILFKASLYDGWYPNSPSASLFFSELVKVVVFLLVLGRNVRSAETNGYQQVQGLGGSSSGPWKPGRADVAQRRAGFLGSVGRIRSLLPVEDVWGRKLELFQIALFQAAANNAVGLLPPCLELSCG
jgi:hypothetical protein